MLLKCHYFLSLGTSQPTWKKHHLLSGGFFSSPGLFLLFLSSLHAESEVREIHAMVGSDVEFGCLYPDRNHFSLNDRLFVYWQIENSKTVVAYYLSNESTGVHVDARYKNRAHLSLERMKQGDFSLHLQNVTPQDNQEFMCLIVRNAEKVLNETVRLHVAANFSTPVISTSGPDTRDQGLTLTCISRNGYPKPNLYWINRTDNSLIDEALQNNTVSLNEWGLYDVISTLTVPWVAHVNVSCSIENVVLHQNLTSVSQAEKSTGNNDSFTGNLQEHRSQNAIFITLASLLVVAGIVVVAWVCRARCLHRRYRGPWTVARELTDHA